MNNPNPSSSQNDPPLSYRAQLISAQLHKKHQTSLTYKLQKHVLTTPILHKAISLQNNTIQQNAANSNHEGNIPINFKLLFQSLSQTDKIHQWKGSPSFSLQVNHIQSKILIKDLSRCLTNTFKNCKNLHLNIAYLDGHDDHFHQKPHQLPVFALQISRHLSHINHLQITIKSQSYLPQESLQTFLKLLYSGPHHPKTLTLNTSCSSPQSDLVSLFLKAKRPLTLSRNISLSILNSDCPIKLKALKTQQNTLDFSLDLSYLHSISDLEFSRIISALLPCYKSSLPISHIALSLKCLWNLKDESFIALVNHLRSRAARTLKELKIDCYAMRKLLGKALVSLSQEIHHFRSLEHVTLRFGDCYRLTDQGVAPLLSKICKHLHKLETLSLDFTRSPQEHVDLTDLSIQSFTENLKELNKLKSLSMNFNGAPKMTGLSLVGLAREINQNLSLNTLNLSFKRCRKITKEDKANAKNEIKKIPKFSIL